MALITEFKNGSLTYRRYAFDSYEELADSGLGAEDEIDWMLGSEGSEEICLFSNRCYPKKDNYDIDVFTEVRRFWKPEVKGGKWFAEIIEIHRSWDSSGNDVFTDEQSRKMYRRVLSCSPVAEDDFDIP